MKILILEGSPHKNGSSNMLADEFMRGAIESGNEVKKIDIAHSIIHPCFGCDFCGMDGECVSKDDMEKFKVEILESDMLVFVTPIYYFGMSAQLKLLIDRFYSFTTKVSSKYFKTALISVAWNSDDATFKPLKTHYEAICNYLNFESLGEIYGKGCGTTTMTSRSIYMTEAYKLGKKIK